MTCNWCAGGGDAAGERHRDDVEDERAAADADQSVRGACTGGRQSAEHGAAGRYRRRRQRRHRQLQDILRRAVLGRAPASRSSSQQAQGRHLAAGTCVRTSESIPVYPR